MSKLEQIVAHGNRGHQPSSDSHIRCADGTVLSVIAGGGTYGWPRPSYCSCGMAIPGWTTPTILPQAPYEAAHDYPGPYTHVEVMLIEGDAPDGWFAEDSVATIAVEDVRAFVAAHGGEVLP